MNMKSRMLKNLHGPSFPVFSNVLHIIMEVSEPSLLIESTDSMIMSRSYIFSLEYEAEFIFVERVGCF